jgi:predicted SAM-dependent methyltransferase
MPITFKIPPHICKRGAQYIYSFIPLKRNECPICGNSFNNFLSGGSESPIFEKYHIIGGGYQENHLCPRCISSYRERLVYLYLKNETNIFNSRMRVLHIAPERSIQKKLKESKYLEYISCDIDSPMAMIKMDITEMYFRNDLFDAVICNHVFEHITNDFKAMAEIYRVLKPNGWAILQVPISLSFGKTYEDEAVIASAEREKAFGQSDHVRIYARDYKNRLEKVGFVVELYDFSQEYGKISSDKYGINCEEKLYICRK